VIVRHVVVSAPARQRGAESREQPIERARDAARQGVEVGDREHDAAARARDARHLGDRFGRRVEVVERALAVDRVEALRCERQRVGPAAQVQDRRARGLRVLHHRKRRHARRRLRGHRERAALRDRARVLAEAARDVEHAPAVRRRGTRAVERAPRHLLEQVIAVRAGRRRDHVAHVSVEIDDPHSGRDVSVCAPAA
jgi:hypothetical protein